MQHTDEVIGRLQALGRHPVDGAAAARHLDMAISATRPAPRRWVTLAAVLIAVIGVPAAGIAAVSVGGEGAPGSEGVAGEGARQPRGPARTKQSLRSVYAGYAKPRWRAAATNEPGRVGLTTRALR